MRVIRCCIYTFSLTSMFFGECYCPQFTAAGLDILERNLNIYSDWP